MLLVKPLRLTTWRPASGRLPICSQFPKPTPLRSLIPLLLWWITSGVCLLPIQLQSRLSRPHRSFQGPDLAHPCSVGNDGVVAYEANSVRSSEKRMVEGIERLE